MQERRYLKTIEAAEYLGLSAATLAKWRVEGGGPIFKRLGRSVRYLTVDLENWANSRSFENTSQESPGRADHR